MPVLSSGEARVASSGGGEIGCGQGKGVFEKGMDLGVARE